MGNLRSGLFGNESDNCSFRASDGHYGLVFDHAGANLDWWLCCGCCRAADNANDPLMSMEKVYGRVFVDWCQAHVPLLYGWRFNRAETILRCRYAADSAAKAP